MSEKLTVAEEKNAAAGQQEGGPSGRGGVNQNVSRGRGSAVAEGDVQVCEGAVSS